MALHVIDWKFLYDILSRASLVCWVTQEQHQTCVPSNFMANRRVPKFSLNNCAQSSKKDVYVP